MKILLVEDNLADAEFLEEILIESSLAEASLIHVFQLVEAWEQLQADTFDAILLDLSLPDSHGLNTLAKVHSHSPDIAILVLTGLNDQEIALQAVREGAQDYLIKGQINPQLLDRAIRYAIERKRSERMICAALAKEQELRALTSSFISMISHEFRNPLTTIIAATDLLQECHQQLDREKQQDLYQRVQKAAARMEQLLNDILIIGSTDIPQESLNLEPLDLIAFCQDLVDEMEMHSQIGNRSHHPFDRSLPEAVKHTIAFKIENCYLGISQKMHGGESSPKPLFDAKVLRQLLSNLLSNAIKYSPIGGGVNFSMILQPKQVIFQVTDRGIGIPEADQKNLFKLFHRGSNIGEITGTGLGLAIVKRSVELHGGELTVTSQVNCGTTFSVTLPLKYPSM